MLPWGLDGLGNLREPGEIRIMLEARDDHRIELMNDHSLVVFLSPKLTSYLIY